MARLSPTEIQAMTLEQYKALTDGTPLRCTYCGDIISAQEEPAPVTVQVRYVTNAAPQADYAFCGLACVAFWTEGLMFS